MLEGLFDGENDKLKCFNDVSIMLDTSSFCQIFANSKAIANGGQLELLSQLFVRHQQYALQKIGFTADIVSSEIVNIIVTYNYACQLNVDLIAKT